MRSHRIRGYTPSKKLGAHFISGSDIEWVTYGVEQSYRGVSRENAMEGLEEAAILMVRHLAPRSGLGLTANLTLSTLNGKDRPG